MKIDDILRNLPTRDEVANAIGLQPRGGASVDLPTALGIFGTGMLLGAGLALLFAPQVGEDLRHEIASKLNGLGKGVGAPSDGRAATESDTSKPAA